MSSVRLSELARAAVGLAVVAVAVAACATPPRQPAPEAAPAETTAPPPPTALPPSPTDPPGTTVRQVMIPMLVGMPAAAAQRLLSGRGLRWTVGYARTGRAPAGTVVSQSRGTGALVAPGTAVALVVAKAPPPPLPTVTAARSNCDPSYPGTCLHSGIGDYDCRGGSGDGPNYVSGPVKVLPPDPFGLDRDGDGWGCES